MVPRRCTRLAVAAVVTAVVVAAACVAPPASQARPCNDDDECGARAACVLGRCTDDPQGWGPGPAPLLEDAGRQDASSVVDGDAGASDGGAPSDAATPDAGELDDGGPLDRGPLDSGPLDGGPVDGGAPDSGAVIEEPVLPDVPGLEGYSLLYEVQLPTRGARFNATGAPYAYDASAAMPSSFTRVGYYLALERTDGSAAFVYVEADALSQDPARLGIPTTRSGAFFQTALSNTRVVSNHDGVTSGTGLALNVEMWPSDYVPSNDDSSASPADADDARLDFGDGSASTSAGHGSLQIHNTSEGRTVLAINDWGGTNPDEALEIGIGDNPAGEPDWTHADNADAYVVKTFKVVVNARPDAPALPEDLPTLPSVVAALVGASTVEDYRVVYQLEIPEVASFNASGVPYAVDRSDDVPPGSFDRIAWLLVLERQDGEVQWVWVSVPAFTLSAERIGVPASGSGIFFQHAVEDGEVRSNVVAPRDGVTLHLEMWHTNYGTASSLPVAGASDATHDFGDRPSPGGYGCMQVHDAAAGETLFAYNRWGSASDPSDLGIGNSPTGNPDWTFRTNSADYTLRHLTVLVRARR